MPDNPVDVQVNDIVQTRKTHPCGNDQWRVYRIGADIGLMCTKCERRVMLPYRQFAKAMKKYIVHAAPTTQNITHDKTHSDTDV